MQRHHPDRPSSSTARRLLRLFALALLVVPALGRAEETAPEPDEPLLAKLEEHLKKPWLRVGVLLQVVGEAQEGDAGGDGFSLGNARLSLGGQLDAGFEYFLQTNFINSPAILDARLTYATGGGSKIDAGLFKAPFSAEFLTGAASIDFVNRSRVVAALAPGRQLGAQLRGVLGDSVEYRLGVFNGNSFRDNRNDNSDLMVAGRLALRRTAGERTVRAGINAATSEDADVDLGGGLASGFAGKRSLAGIDFRVEHGRWLFAGEGIFARLEPRTGPVIEPSGFHATVGYKPTPRSQWLLRWDHFAPRGARADSDVALLGYNLWPTRATEIQVNLLQTVDGAPEDGLGLLLNLQVAF